MKTDEKSKMYTCAYCKKISETVGIVQTELRYYSLVLGTNQWEDFHGDEEVKSQELFCVHCNKNLNSTDCKAIDI